MTRGLLIMLDNLVDHGTEINALKQKYREKLKAQRGQLTQQQRQNHSTQIIGHLLQYLPSLSSDIQLLIYRSLPHEVDTSALFKHAQAQIFVPRMLPNMGMAWVKIHQDTQWVTADFGILEPEQGEVWQPSNLKTILLCPLLGFDKSGNRLGMGKGYYDRWLHKHVKDVSEQLGLAFSCQELCKVPVEPHDAPLSTIITEHGVISCPTA